jgi:hypothetical protein
MSSSPFVRRAASDAESGVSFLPNSTLPWKQLELWRRCPCARRTTILKLNKWSQHMCRGAVAMRCRAAIVAVVINEEHH